MEGKGRRFFVGTIICHWFSINVLQLPNEPYNDPGMLAPGSVLHVTIRIRIDFAVRKNYSLTNEAYLYHGIFIPHNTMLPFFEFQHSNTPRN